jgi:hypothetical protein
MALGPGQQFQRYAMIRIDRSRYVVGGARRAKEGRPIEQ